MQKKSNTSTSSSKPRAGHLYTTGKKSLWQLQYDVLGKRTRISLRTSDKHEAELRAQEILGRIKFVTTRQEYLQALVKMGEEAQRELGDTKTMTGAIQVGSAFALYLASVRRPQRANDNSLNRYKSYTEELCRLARNKPTMNSIDGLDAETCMKALELDNSSATVNMKLGWFRLLWNTLGVKPNPWEGLKSTKKNDSKPWRRFTHGECVRIYEAAGEYQFLILIGYYTGQRLSDCLTISHKLNKGPYEPPVDMLSIRQGKTGKMVHLPMLPELQCFSVVTYIMTSADISRNIKKILHSVGIEDNGSRVGFHSFRKTFVSMMDEAGCPINVTNSITGHDSGSMHDRYSQTDVDTARKWMEKALPPLSTLS